MPAALKYASEVLPKDAYGSVRVDQIRFMAFDEDDVIESPYLGFWEAFGTTLHISGDGEIEEVSQ